MRLSADISTFEAEALFKGPLRDAENRLPLHRHEPSKVPQDFKPEVERAEDVPDGMVLPLPEGANDKRIFPAAPRTVPRGLFEIVRVLVGHKDDIAEAPFHGIAVADDGVRLLPRAPAVGVRRAVAADDAGGVFEGLPRRAPLLREIPGGENHCPPKSHVTSRCGASFRGQAPRKGRRACRRRVRVCAKCTPWRLRGDRRSS